MTMENPEWERTWERNCRNSYKFLFKNDGDADNLVNALDELVPKEGPKEVQLADIAKKAGLKTNPANDEIIYFYKCSPDGVSFAICSKSRSHPTPTTIRLIAEAICGTKDFSMTYWTENTQTGVCASDNYSVISQHWGLDSDDESPREDACLATDDELIEWLKKKRGDHFSGNVTAENMIKLAVWAGLFDRKQFLYYHYVEADMWGR